MKTQKHKINQPSKFDGTAAVNTLITLRSSTEDRVYLLVPPSLAGLKIGEVKLLSINAPLTKCLLHHPVGFSFTFDGTAFQIVDIKPNL